ncbi:MAG: DUF971 domain-containing protein [Verrucomicrobia bacterium]|nr:DUF971 domain-containing protein [Verrucomicrobiota bacterium]
MRPVDIQQIGNELAIKWEDESEHFISLEKLRRHCPCAACRGETDVMGKIHKGPPQTLSPTSFQLQKLSFVGSYGIQPAWGDGHTTGIYTFDYLKNVAVAEEGGN